MHTIHRHQCIIYSGPPSVHIQSLAITMIGKLKGKKRCLYLNSPAMVDQMRVALTAGMNPLDEVEKGALILTSDQSHLVNGKFDVDRMIDMLGTALQQALADGYTGLWATGDMTWEFGNESNFSKLFEYEHRLETFMQNNPALSGICQYHCDTIPVHAMNVGLHTHPALYINDTLSRINPDYTRTSA